MRKKNCHQTCLPAGREKLVMPKADPPQAENRPFRFHFPPTHRFGRAGKVFFNVSFLPEESLKLY